VRVSYLEIFISYEQMLSSNTWDINYYEGVLPETCQHICPSSGFTLEVFLYLASSLAIQNYKAGMDLKNKKMVLFLKNRIYFAHITTFCNK